MKTKVHLSRRARAIAADRRLMAVLPLAAMLLLADPALAQSTGSSAIQSGLTQVQSWLTTIASTVGVIAVMAVGYAKLTGKLDWGKAVAVLIGIGIIFSATTIVGWMTSS